MMTQDEVEAMEDWTKVWWMPEDGGLSSWSHPAAQHQYHSQYSCVTPSLPQCHSSWDTYHPSSDRYPLPPENGFQDYKEIENGNQFASSEMSLVTCPFCSRSFRKRGYLAQHVSAAHSVSRPYKCSKCGKKFREAGSLAVHASRHSGDKPYKCPHCSRQYQRKFDLKRHLWSHKERLPFQCYLCTSQFARQDHLVSHLARHSLAVPPSPQPSCNSTEMKLACNVAN